MIIQHRKNKTDHYITVEEWERLGVLKMQGSYKVIDSSELLTKNINVNEIEVFQINLDEVPKKPKKTKIKTNDSNSGENPDRDITSSNG